MILMERVLRALVAICSGMHHTDTGVLCGSCLAQHATADLKLQAPALHRA